jgi:hypothetical protein
MAERSMESFSGMLEYKGFPEGIQASRRTLDEIRRKFVFPEGVISQPILMCLDALLFDQVMSSVHTFPVFPLPPVRSIHDTLKICVGSVQVHTSIDLGQDDQAICKQLYGSITACGGKIRATIFVVGGLMALRRIPTRSALSGFGKELARRFWKILKCMREALGCKLVFLGAGVAPRDNPANLQPHAVEFLEELVRLGLESPAGGITYCDIYSPGSFTEFSSVGAMLRESTDMIDRFVRDLKVVAGESMNPKYEI